MSPAPWLSTRVRLPTAARGQRRPLPSQRLMQECWFWIVFRRDAVRARARPRDRARPAHMKRLLPRLRPRACILSRVAGLQSFPAARVLVQPLVLRRRPVLARARTALRSCITMCVARVGSLSVCKALSAHKRGRFTVSAPSSALAPRDTFSSPRALQRCQRRSLASCYAIGRL